MIYLFYQLTYTTLEYTPASLHTPLLSPYPYLPPHTYPITLPHPYTEESTAVLQNPEVSGNYEPDRSLYDHMTSENTPTDVVRRQIVNAILGII